MVQYVPFVLMALVGVLVFGAAALFVSRKAAPASSIEGTDGGSSSFTAEAVVEHRGNSLLPLHVPLIAMLSSIGLVVTLAVVLWSGDFRHLGGFGLAVVLLFLVATFAGVIYAVGAGALEWGPVQLDVDDEGDEPIDRLASTEAQPSQ